MTAHIESKKQDIAKVVLMPGDPLRAQWIAETFLENAKCVNKVRGMLAFTGTYKGKRITVMGHGMGIPSIGIYSYELMKFYDVDTIIRIGSCGALTKKLKLGDVVIGEKAYSESPYGKMMGVKVVKKTLKATPSLVKLAKETAKELKIKAEPQIIISEDAFYQEINKPADMVKKHNATAIEMEAFALYANAIKTKKQALTLLTVSDSLVTHQAMTPEERQTTFKSMVKLALEMGVSPKIKAK